MEFELDSLVAFAMLVAAAARAATILRRAGSATMRALLGSVIALTPLFIAALLFHDEPWFRWFSGSMLAIFLAWYVVGPLLRVVYERARSPAKQFALAIREGRLRDMQRLLVRGVVEPNGLSTDAHRSWLRFAVELEATAQCQVLLDNGANPYTPDATGMSVMDYLLLVGDRSAQLSKIRSMCEKTESGR